MAEDNREQSAVRTTIVGGRPRGSGKEEAEIPRGIEILLKKAAIDESFRKLLISDRLKAADAIELVLNPAEATVLKAIPEPSLKQMVAATKVQPKIRPAFMGYTATVMLAALTAVSDGAALNTGAGIAGSTAINMSAYTKEQEAQDAPYKAKSYIKIAPQDEKAPRGSLAITIRNWRPSIANRYLKVNLTKTEPSTPVGNSRTEASGYAIGGTFLMKDIPVGNYLMEIIFEDGTVAQTKNIAIREKEIFNLYFQYMTATPAGTVPPGKNTTKVNGFAIYIE